METFYGSSWIENSKFSGVIFLIGVHKSNNESVAWLFSILDEHFQSHYE